MDSRIALSEVSGLPNIFDVISAESVSGELLPFVTKLLNGIFGRYTSHGNYLRVYVDEIVFCLNLVVEARFLFKHSSSLGEHFYELVRIDKNQKSISPESLSRFNKIRSLIILVVIPYVHRKLSRIYNEIMTMLTLYQRRASQQGDNAGNNMTEAMRYFISLAHRVRVFYDAVEFVLKIMYMMNWSEAPSIWLYVAGVRLRKFNPSTAGIDANSGLFSAIFGRPFSDVFSRGFGILLFGLRVASVWNQQHQSGSQNETVSLFDSVVSSDRSILPSPKKSSAFKNTACPLCNENLSTPTVLPACGLAFCFKCIYKYVIDNQCCPITKLPASTKDLVKLFL